MKKGIIFSLLCATLLSNQVSAFSLDDTYIGISGSFMKTHSGTKATLNTKRGEMIFDNKWIMFGSPTGTPVNTSPTNLYMPANAYFSGLTATGGAVANKITAFTKPPSGSMKVYDTQGNLRDSTPAELTAINAALVNADKIPEDITYYVLTGHNQTTANTAVSTISSSSTAFTTGPGGYIIQTNEKLHATVNNKEELDDFFHFFKTRAVVGGAGTTGIANNTAVNTVPYSKLTANNILKEVEVTPSGQTTQEKDILYGGAIKAGTSFKNMMFEGEFDINRIFYRDSNNRRIFHTDNLQFGVNTYVNLDFGSVLVPHILVGVGINRSNIEMSKLDDTYGKLSMFVKDTDPKKKVMTRDMINLKPAYDLTYKAGFGTSLYFTSSLSIVAGYEFKAPFSSKGFEYKAKSFDGMDELTVNKTLKLYNSLHNFTIGMKYYF